MSGLFIFGVIFLAVVCMVIAISKFNMHPFLVLTVIAVLVGLVCGIPTEEVISTVLCAAHKAERNIRSYFFSNFLQFIGL